MLRMACPVPPVPTPRAARVDAPSATGRRRGRRARRPLLSLLLLIGAIVASCQRYRTPRPAAGELAPARYVRVTFAPAAPVTLASRSGAASLHVTAREVSGPVLQVAGDSLTLRVWHARDAHDLPVEPPIGAVLTVVRSDSAASR